MNEIFYVYVWVDMRKPGRYVYGEGEYCFLFEPFYVGKGTIGRWKDTKQSRNPHFIYKFNKIKRSGFEPISIKVKENITNDESKKLEIELIGLIGRENLKKGPLVNMTDGGEGSSGYVFTEEQLEKLRKNFLDIQKFFEGRGYELITKEKDYKNSKQKLDYSCSKNHKGSISWHDFQQGFGCPYCAKNKIDFLEIKKEFEKRDYILLIEEKDYKNNETKLNYICPKNHKGSICWGNFQQGNSCYFCGIELQAKKLRKNFSNIQKLFEEKEYHLLTEEKDYKNKETKLNYICNREHEHSINWNNFQQKVLRNNKCCCPKCNKEDREKNRE